MPETIPENLEIVLKARKYSKNHKKSRKIPRARLGYEQSK
jgi:hypothetical protein